MALCHLEVFATGRRAWAAAHGIHPRVLDHLTDRPDHLWSEPKTGEPFSTPRSRHMLSDALPVITDGWCDVLRIRREHAHPVPQGRHPPFTPRGPVFRVR